ncbi:Hemolytic lectin LSLb [Mycena venus]|uniref:Hemolytic lectin LSLb n=1 Tax=Mycena venus TaxID=2733690 RepID=A0A8H7DDL1_9AGAR|nr:Hemolytic lectin LSLb [Mycena venus]
MPELYIPSEGIYFRLLGYSSNCCIYSRNENEPYVSHYDVSNGAFAGQWFSVLAGTGTHAGLYAIKGKGSGKVLYSRANNDPKVSYIAGDGQYEDKFWFRFDEGTGTYKGHFRLITPSENMALYSRASNDPTFHNYSASSVYSDHYFSFLFEDMTVKKVEYDTDKAQITSSQQLVIFNEEYANGGSIDMQTSISVSETKTHTSTFDYTLGFTITVGATFSAKLPYVANGKVTTSVANQHQFKWGSTDSITHHWSATFNATIPPHKTIKAVSTVTQGTLTVPYTITLSSKSGITTTTKGTWSGTSTWDLKNTVTEI